MIPERGNNEAVPTFVEVSSQVDDHPAEHAIDLNLGTQAQADRDSSNKVWLQVKLDQVYCVQQVIEFGTDGAYQFEWTCSESDCDACIHHKDNTNCKKWFLSVSMTDDNPIDTNTNVGNNCKLGNTVRLEKLEVTNPLTVAEIAIIGTKG